MSPRDQREDALDRHGRFSWLMVGRSQTSKDRAESSFVSDAGVLGAYQHFGSTLVFRIFRVFLETTLTCPRCALKELLVEIVPFVHTGHEEILSL